MVHSVPVLGRGQMLASSSSGACAFLHRCLHPVRNLPAATCLLALQFTENLDLSDFSEQLYKGKKRAALNQWACWDNSKACSKKAPPLPAVRAHLRR
jgi:hypothetical protein